MKMTTERAIEKAREVWCQDNLQIDDNATTSEGGDPGCWVSAWVWVTDDEAEDKE